MQQHICIEDESFFAHRINHSVLCRLKIGIIQVPKKKKGKTATKAL